MSDYDEEDYREQELSEDEQNRRDDYALRYREWESDQRSAY